MKTKYYVSFFGIQIRKVNVTRESASSWWFERLRVGADPDEEKVAKKYGRIYDSFAEAKTGLYAMQLHKVKTAEVRLEQTRELLARIGELTET